jgi:ornithine cyclodeaminase/alanine dehydrogenase-like protein (mu-crystallin family)
VIRQRRPHDPGLAVEDLAAAALAYRKAAELATGTWVDF